MALLTLSVFAGLLPRLRSLSDGLGDLIDSIICDRLSESISKPDILVDVGGNRVSSLLFVGSLKISEENQIKFDHYISEQCIQEKMCGAPELQLCMN